MYPKKQPLFLRFLSFSKKKKVNLTLFLKKIPKGLLKKDTNKALKTVGIEDTDLYPFLEYYTYLFFKAFYKQKKRKVFTKKQHFEQIKNRYIH